MEFEFVAGDASLDFVATMSEWTTTRLERLTSPEDLAEWLVGAGIVDAAPAATQDDLLAARELRRYLYDFLVRITEGRPPSRAGREVINTYAAAPPPLVAMTSRGLPTTAGTVDAALSQLARQAIRLGAEDRRRFISWCDDATCTRAFIDRSRGGRRRWCGMSGCGDRAKAAAYRQRRSAGI